MHSAAFLRLSAFRLHKGSTKPMYTPSAQLSGKNLCENKNGGSYKKEASIQRALRRKAGRKDSNNDEAENFKD